jgi:undecaprenyl diphosphate synthase
VLEAQELTRNNTGITLCIAFSYGGRAEIVDAVKRMIAEGIDPKTIDEATFGTYLNTNGVPDPDLVIRTAGELRLSNFLIWQAAYAEFYSTPTCWPDFDREALYQALVEYSRRNRKFGGILPEERGEYAEQEAPRMNGSPQESVASDAPDAALAQPDPAVVK